MFTGIIETIAEVLSITPQGSNINIELSADISNSLKIDQSVSHNGVCLTVVELTQNGYVVTAIE